MHLACLNVLCLDVPSTVFFVLMYFLIVFFSIFFVLFFFQQLTPGPVTAAKNKLLSKNWPLNSYVNYLYALSQYI